MTNVTIDRLSRSHGAVRVLKDVSPDAARDLPARAHVGLDLEGVSLFDPTTGRRL